LSKKYANYNDDWEIEQEIGLTLLGLIGLEEVRYPKIASTYYDYASTGKTFGLNKATTMVCENEDNIEIDKDIQEVVDAIFDGSMEDSH
jgi:hypothetical protein